MKQTIRYGFYHMESPFCVCTPCTIPLQNEDFESIFDKNAKVLDVPLELFDASNVDLPRVGSKIVEMPIFMLDLAVCPGGVVPLHIFEMRYRQVRRSCFSSLSLFFGGGGRGTYHCRHDSSTTTMRRSQENTN